MILGSIAAAILLLIFCPLPLRISGAAVVAPQSVVTLAAPVEGNIANVYAREGQHVAVAKCWEPWMTGHGGIS